MCCCRWAGSFCSADAIDSPSLAAALRWAPPARRARACAGAPVGLQQRQQAHHGGGFAGAGPPVMSVKRLRAASAQATFCQSGAFVCWLASNSCASDSPRLAGTGQAVPTGAIEARMFCWRSSCGAGKARPPEPAGFGLRSRAAAALWARGGSVRRSRHAWPSRLVADQAAARVSGSCWAARCRNAH